ncbi:YlbF family regulator [Bacillaceae bacterium SIJ1]|uniref:YlbF family regulator n=1 Tax=Litoribacterium kuwaitense TaxID=1398745 RepID=UPI0013ED6AB6|nr:YlbF family regulator [Litoribacterium kuwaitense]NGP43894.1 YlbF family regulator [Litoribacterium kuwaitense]
MMANMYDEAYNLEKAIRGSEEFQKLSELYEQLQADEMAKKLFDNFRQVQMDLQQKQMQGEEITQEDIEQAQKQAQLVQQHDLISKVMEVEQRLSQSLTDINKIIMKPLEELYGTMES